MSRQIRTRASPRGLLGTSCLTQSFRLLLPACLIRARKGTKESGAFRKISEVAPFSATAEALRSVKVAIDLNAVAGNVIGIVSALPGEGKTTIAALAAFFAKSGARTLLIDGDLRNPSMSNTLGYSNYPGLLELVANNASAHDLVIYDLKRTNSISCLHRRSFKPASSADILISPAVKQLLTLAASDYDCILVDLPPILAVVDVKAAAHLFDAFVLVVEWGSTSTDDVVRAVAASNTLARN